MNISKRTIIIAVIALLTFVAAFASLYLEKEQEISDLVNIPEPTAKKRTSKKEETITDAVIVNDQPESNGTTTE